VAAEVGADAVSLDLWQQAFADADAVVCAVAASAPVVSLGALRDAVAARASRPLVIVDLSMPPVVEPGEVAGVVRVDLSVLEPLVAEHRDRRAAEVPKVQAIVDRELQHLDAWARHHALRPLVSDLRRKVEAIRQAELARAIEGLEGGQAADVRVLERLSRRLLDQLLAIPLGPLQAGHVPIDPAQAQYLRRLFGLEPESRP
jgi:glutamyl-tRNA reductase